MDFFKGAFMISSFTEAAFQLFYCILLLIFEIYDYYYVFKNKGFLRFAYYFNCSCYFFYFQAAVFNIFYGCVVFMIRCQS